VNHFEVMIVFAIATINPYPKINKNKTFSQVVITYTLNEGVDMITK